jgi:hypothetical protein
MTLAVSARLGPYEVLAPLGVDGMGEVYRARYTRLRGEVANKVLYPGLTKALVRGHGQRSESDGCASNRSVGQETRRGLAATQGQAWSQSGIAAHGDAMTPSGWARIIRGGY